MTRMNNPHGLPGASSLADAMLSLDLHHVAPAMQRRLIFRAFDGLVIGGTLEILGDEDPRPLCTELTRRCDGAYTASVLEGGPSRWIVRLIKNGQCIDGEQGSQV